MKNGLWTFLLIIGGFLIGLALGLLLSWVVIPIRYVNTGPATLRIEFKDQYRAAIASAYNATGNLERANARLALLGDPNPEQALIGQAQRVLVEGKYPDTAFDISVLVNALKNQPTAVQNGTAVSIPTITSTPTLLPTSAISFVNTPRISATPGASPTLLPTATHLPTVTPSVTPGQPFKLTSREDVCNPDLPVGLLQVEVRDASRKPIAGMKIVISWNNGEENIFTGLKPEIGNGYADFVMEENVTYSVKLAAGGEVANDLTIAACQGADGELYSGGVKLIFQQP
jgi:hypothetical protein